MSEAAIEERKDEERKVEERFKFSPAVEKAWNAIELPERKRTVKEVLTKRQEALVTTMSNARAQKQLLDLRQETFEKDERDFSADEEKARVAEIDQLERNTEAMFLEVEVLASECETLSDTLAEMEESGSVAQFGGDRATRRRAARGK